MRLNIKEGQTTTARHKVFQDALLLDQSNNFIPAHNLDVGDSQKKTPPEYSTAQTVLDL